MALSFSVDLTDRVVVVTGGYGVLGSSWVDALAEAGAKVAILGRNVEKAEAKAEELRNRNFQAIGVKADVLDRESLSHAHEVVKSTFGPCDILINGAGGNHPSATTTKEYLWEEDVENVDTISFFDLKADALRHVFDTNLLGTILTTQEFARDMVGRKGCSIINISSMNAFIPLTKIPAYSSAKAAVSNFTQWLAVHFSKVGIRVNAIAPGFFETTQNRELLRNADGSYSPRAKKIIESTPMGRFGTPEELVGALLFLISEEASSFINGIVLPVDGGFSAYSGV